MDMKKKLTVTFERQEEIHLARWGRHFEARLLNSWQAFQLDKHAVHIPCRLQHVYLYPFLIISIDHFLRLSGAAPRLIQLRVMSFVATMSSNEGDLIRRSRGSCIFWVWLRKFDLKVDGSLPSDSLHQITFL